MRFTTARHKLQKRKLRENRTKVFIDMLSVQGHITLNNFYVRQLCQEPTIFICSSMSNAYQEFKTGLLGVQPCGRGIGERLLTTMRVLRILLTERPQTAVFLSYDLASFALISRVAAILRTHVVCFEHNTAPRTRAKRLMHRLMARKVIRLVYASHVQDIYSRAGIGTIHVPHPCIAPAATNVAPDEWKSLVARAQVHFRRTAFCPSGSVSLESIESIARQDPDTLFVCKSRENSELPNVLCHSYFEDYAGALAQCDLVFVPFTLDYKVSGPGFEAIAMGKPVMLLENAFGQYMKQLFPAQVFFPGGSVPHTERSDGVAHAHNAKITQTLVALLEPIAATHKIGGNRRNNDATTSNTTGGH